MGTVYLEVLKADLNRLHVSKELIKATHIQLGLEADLFWNFLNLRQVRVHQAGSLHVFIVVRKVGWKGYIILLLNLRIDRFNCFAEMGYTPFN